MSLFAALTAKPWVQEGVEDVPAWGRLPMPTAKVALIVFLAVVTTLFSLLVVAYFMRMSLEDWRPLPEPPVLWLNTAVLVLGSVALQGSSAAARRGRPDAARIAFMAGGACTALFLIGQLAAWWQLDALGYFVATNPANTFFSLMTALHGLHLVGGIVAWNRTAVRLSQAADVARLRLSIQLCATYWHFLLAVWLALFAVLLADNGGKITLLHLHQASYSVGTSIT